MKCYKFVSYFNADVAELVDALDLGSSGLKPVRVRVSPSVR